MHRLYPHVSASRLRIRSPHPLAWVIVLLGSLCVAPCVSAQEATTSTAPDGLVPAPEPPEIPESVQSGEALEPEIIIIQREQETVQEYRINGQLYKVKITPSSGAAYYLIDTDGDGELETRSNDIVSDSSIPQWVLFSW